MNEIFSIKRFWESLRSDIIAGTPKMLWSVFISLLIMPAWFVINIALSSGPILPDSRSVGMVAITAVLIFIAPFLIYNNANNRKKGIEYTMRPASSLEKFLSMILLCNIILPIILMILYLIEDSIMTTIPNELYTNYVLPHNLWNKRVTEALEVVLLMPSFSLCCNMLFRKAKLGKAVLVGISGLIILGGIITHYTSKITMQEMSKQSVVNVNIVAITNTNAKEDTTTISTTKEHEIGNTIEGRLKNMFQIIGICGYILSALMYYLTFNRIQKQQL